MYVPSRATISDFGAGCDQIEGRTRRDLQEFSVQHPVRGERIDHFALFRDDAGFVRGIRGVRAFEDFQ